MRPALFDRQAWIIAVLGLFSACSGSVSAGDAGPDALGDAAVDARPEVALRADGCPVSGASSNFFDYCPKGKVCEYPEECSPLNVKYTIQRCQTNKDYTTSWYSSGGDCSSLTGPDGCPLGHASNVRCTELGKVLPGRLLDGVVIRLLDGAREAIKERGGVSPRSLMGSDQKRSSVALSSSSTVSGRMLHCSG